MPTLRSLPPLPEHFGNPSLRDLSEVVPTADISLWPQTPAWTVLALLLGVWLLRGLREWYRRWLRNRYRREALDALTTLSRQVETPQPGSINEILKLAALAHQERKDVAGLSGTAWTTWLNAQVAQPAFSSPSVQALSEGLYAPAHSLSATEAARLLQEARQWVVQHQDPHAPR